MEITTVSHAGIANRIKNILSAMSQYDKVNTLYETINYIFPSLELVEDPIKTYDEDWRLYVDPEEEKYIEEFLVTKELMIKTMKEADCKLVDTDLFENLYNLN